MTWHSCWRNKHKKEKKREQKQHQQKLITNLWFFCSLRITTFNVRFAFFISIVLTLRITCLFYFISFDSFKLDAFTWITAYGQKSGYENLWWLLIKSQKWNSACSTLIHTHTHTHLLFELSAKHLFSHYNYKHTHIHKHSFIIALFLDWNFASKCDAWVLA